MKDPDKKKGNVGTPDARMYDFIFFLARLWQGKRMDLEIDDSLLQGVEPPYILLSNHESFEDFYYISQMAHPRRPSYLVNEYYCTRPILKTMAKRAGILSKKLFTRDMSTGVGLLRMVRKGYPVVIFPEGRLSPDGRSNPVVEPGGGLYKRLKIDLVLVKLDGAYYAHPKWRKKLYPSKIRLRVLRVLGKDELRQMRDEEIDRVIAETLWNDASALDWQSYPQKDKAEGLEGLLYRCADCGALYTTRGSGNVLRCRACGRSHTLDEHYRFTAAPWSIPGYYDEIRRREAEELGRLSLQTRVRAKIFGANGGPVRWEEGECRLDRKAFSYRSDSREFSIPTEKLPALAFSCGEEFELYHDNELHYFYPTEEPLEPARWGLCADLLAEERRRGMTGGKKADGKEE